MNVVEQIKADVEELGYELSVVKHQLYRISREGERAQLVNGIEALQYWTLNKQRMLIK